MIRRIHLLSLFLFVAAMVFASSCINRNAAPETTREGDSPLRIPLSQPSPIFRPTSAVNLEVKSTNTTSPSPPVSTLDPQAVVKRVSNLMMTNGECTFPCIWGILPGKTAEQELIERIFARENQVFIRNDGLLYENRYVISDNPREQVSIQAHFNEKDMVVNYLLLSAGLRIEENMSLPEAWKPYLLSTMLTDYGIPERIRIYVPEPTEHPGQTTYYEIWLIYPERKTSVSYIGGRIDAQVKPRICPYSSETGIKSMSVFTYYDNKRIPSDMLVFTYGEASIDLNPHQKEEFFALFSDKNSTECFSFD